jgi:hypothetical protein
MSGTKNATACCVVFAVVKISMNKVVLMLAALVFILLIIPFLDEVEDLLVNKSRSFGRVDAVMIMVDNVRN